ncbi:MAG: hypothetical protein AAF265_11805 [Pseudomonadota bacterium]
MTDDNTSERWRRTKQLFNAARTKPAVQQTAFLRRAAADDEDLFREVQLLLRAAENTERSFEDVVAEATRQVGHCYGLSQSRSYRSFN